MVIENPSLRVVREGLPGRKSDSSWGGWKEQAEGVKRRVFQTKGTSRARALRWERIRLIEDLERDQCEAEPWGARCGRGGQGTQAKEKNVVFAQSVMENLREVSSGKMTRSLSCQEQWGNRKQYGSCCRQPDKRCWHFSLLPMPDS